MLALIATAVAFASPPAVVAPAPLILIVPGWTLGKDGPTTSLSLANYFAQEFQDDGRLTPVVWGPTDAVFRTAALDGKLGNVPDFAKPEDVPAVTKALKTEYVLYYTSKQEADKLRVKGQLFQGGRSIWSKEDTIGALNARGVFDKENTNATIAHTWLILIFKTALKQYSVQKAPVPTPEIAPGQAPQNVGQKIAPAGPSDSQALFASFNGLVKDGKPAAAEAFMRDAIDAVPLDPKRRVALIQLLMNQRDFDGAAQASLLASRILPDSVELQLLTIRSHLAAGKTKSALDVANEYAARDVSGIESRLALAEVHLAMGQPDRSVEDLEKIAKDAAPPALFLLRAAARANLGGSDGCELDLAQYAKRATVPDERLYLAATGAVDQGIVDTIKETQAAFQGVTAKRSTAELAESIERLLKLSLSRNTYFQRVSVPSRFKESHEIASLGANLLRLSLLDLAAAAKGNEDVLTDARINFGESVKQLLQARELRAKESVKGSGSGVGEA